jgi:hypothetical protein
MTVVSFRTIASLRKPVALLAKYPPAFASENPGCRNTIAELTRTAVWPLALLANGALTVRLVLLAIAVMTRFSTAVPGTLITWPTLSSVRNAVPDPASACVVVAVLLTVPVRLAADVKCWLSGVAVLGVEPDNRVGRVRQ